ncbi:MAG: AAA family ATPase [Bacteroidales bacterium]|nr:AAA family ATPase [Bacteroidales bacterium]
MIDKIEINNFKCLGKVDMELRPLTVLTGCNSTGKSSCFQAILTCLNALSAPSRLLLEMSGLGMDFSFEALRNRLNNAKEYSIRLENGEKWWQYTGRPDGAGQREDFNMGLELERNVYYLNANRLAFKNIEPVSQSFKCGVFGDFLMGTFENEKSRSLTPEVVRYQEWTTLGAQVEFWLSYITGQEFEVTTETVTANQVKTEYKAGKIDHLAPSQLGVGISSVARLVILCLRAQRDDMIMIENPELHLHPAAQARLGEFFAYVAKAGRQVLIETHCEHLINRLQYEVMKKRISNDDVAIYYKGAINQDFLRVELKKDGRFATDFPEGFFDATLQELIELG